MGRYGANTMILRTSSGHHYRSCGTYWAPWGSCFPWEYDGADLWFDAMQPFKEWKFPGHGHSLPVWATILILATLLLTFGSLAWLALYFRRYFRDEIWQLPTAEVAMPTLEVTPRKGDEGDGIM